MMYWAPAHGWGIRSGLRSSPGSILTIVRSMLSSQFNRGGKLSSKTLSAVTQQVRGKDKIWTLPGGGESDRTHAWSTWGKNLPILIMNTGVRNLCTRNIRGNGDSKSVFVFSWFKWGKREGRNLYVSIFCMHPIMLLSSWCIISSSALEHFECGSHCVRLQAREARSGWLDQAGLQRSNLYCFIQVTSKICLKLSDFTDNTRWLPRIRAIRGLLASLLCPQIPLMAIPGVHGHCQSGSSSWLCSKPAAKLCNPESLPTNRDTCVWC